MLHGVNTKKSRHKSEGDMRELRHAKDRQNVGLYLRLKSKEDRTEQEIEREKRRSASTQALRHETIRLNMAANRSTERHVKRSKEAKKHIAVRTVCGKVSYTLHVF